MNPYRSALEEALNLARQGLLSAAIERIDSVLDDAFSHATQRQISLLVRNVALFCEQAGDFLQAAVYYERFLAAFGNSAAILYSLSRAYAGLGESARSEHYRKLARRVAAEHGDLDMLDLLGENREGK